MRPPGSSESLESRRHQAVELDKQGLSQGEIAQRLKTTPQSVGRWLRAYRRGGAARLAAKPTPGRPPRLNALQRRRLRSRLIRGALANGYETDLWTCPRIVELIQRCYGVAYHVDHIPRLMARMGFSCQKPERRALERDEQEIRRWVEVEWSRLKKRHTPPSPSGVHR
jgi:transposase